MRAQILWVCCRACASFSQYGKARMREKSTESVGSISQDHQWTTGSSVDASTSSATCWWISCTVRTKRHLAALSNQPTFHAAHRAALDTNSLTLDQAGIRLGLALQKTRAKKLYFVIRQGERLAAVADQLPNPGSA